MSSALLLHMDGSNGSTTFTDSSPYGRAVTGYGSAQISTAQSKFGGASGYFDGTGANYVQMTPAAELQFSGNFTIALYVYTTSTSDQVVASSSSDTNTQIFRLNSGGGGTNTVSCFLNGNYVFNNSASGVTLINAWHHVAMTRQGWTTRLFVDGNVIATTTAFTDTFRMDVIGRMFFSGSSYQYQFSGYMDEVLVINGTALYATNFTPPTAPFA